MPRLPFVFGCLALAVLLVTLRLPVAWADPTVPPLTGRVVDLANVLSSAAERDLTDQLAQIEADTGAQIVVATLPGLAGYSIETWGLALGRGWKIGRAGRDDGIVVVLAPNDRKVRIEVGYGLEGRIPDATAHRIIKSYMLPAAREGKYADGLKATVDALRRVIRDPAAPIGRQSRGIEFGSTGLIILFGGMAFFALFAVILAVSFRRGWTSPSWDNESTSDDEGSSFDSGWSRSSFGSSSSSFSGGGGSFGGGGASGKW